VTENVCLGVGKGKRREGKGKGREGEEKVPHCFLDKSNPVLGQIIGVLGTYILLHATNIT